ncbi:MAG: MogA/MoaB family molybdenum cofactor biosynthesis protein [Deltaproteobacteria bacterium]|nr:MogA/MoaB family molybdenum cofactor biosynthesis protein [Deltaproteobacteria bacterium]
MLRVAVLTVSDRSSEGIRPDASGPVLVKRVGELSWEVTGIAICPDDVDSISKQLVEWSDNDIADLILTTGGTGLAPRDVTPEATQSVVTRLIPGIPEAMRAASLLKTPHAMLSRGLAGVRGRSLIINLPGSPKAALENLDAVAAALEHAVSKIQGDPSDCAQT